MIVAFVPSEAERESECSFDAAPIQRGDRGLKAATLRASQCAHHLATKLGHMRMKMNGQVWNANGQLKLSRELRSEGAVNAFYSELN